MEIVLTLAVGLIVGIIILGVVVFYAIVQCTEAQEAARDD